MTAVGTGRSVVGFIGLGDQGLPIAAAIAEAGFDLHIWQRPPGPEDVLGDTPHTVHGSPEGLARVCDIVGLCVSTDDDVDEVARRLLTGLRAGSVIVNHGTGTPRNALRLTELCARSGVEVLDAPVSGGRPASEARALLTMVGGPAAVAQRCEPVFQAFSESVVHLGGAGSGQTMKLLNNALLMMNQANIADIIDLAVSLGMDPAPTAEVLKLGSATSRALTLLNTMVTLETVDRLTEVQLLDMDLFESAMADRDVAAEFIMVRGVEGSRRLAWLVRALSR